ncbi:MAG: TldD/PmbA family protein [Nitrososphaerota archaeon]
MAMEDLLNYAVDYAMRMGASYAEVRYQSDSFEEFTLRNGVSEAPAFGTSRGLSVRVIVSGSMGFASTNLTKKADVRDVVGRAITVAKASSKVVKNAIRMVDAKSTRAECIVKPRVKPEFVDPDSKVELLKEVDGRSIASASRGDVKFPMRMLSVGHWIAEKHIVTSEGSNVHSRIPRVMFSYMLTVAKAGKGTTQRFENMGESGGWERVERWVLDERVPEEVGKLAKILTEAVEPPTDTLDVVLGPELVGIICHESAGHPLEADRVLGREAAQGGETYVTRELIGEYIGSEHVTIVDDPRLPNSFGYYLYDDECVEARERVLIDRGKINELLHNRETAAEFDTLSNGSSRASFYGVEPIVRMANTYMRPGDYSLEELIEGVRYGVYISSYMEWNIDDRRWNQRYVGLEAYLIKNGRLESMLRNPTIELTTKGLYSSVDAVGKDIRFYAGYCGKSEPMQSMPVWFGGPAIRLRGIRLGRSPVS